jgi:excisionase family DNA binding protein
MTHATPPPDALLTSRDLTSRLNISHQTICKWTAQGKLPALRLPNGAYRYRKEDIDAWLAARSNR